MIQYRIEVLHVMTNTVWSFHYETESENWSLPEAWIAEFQSAPSPETTQLPITYERPYAN